MQKKSKMTEDFYNESVIHYLLHVVNKKNSRSQLTFCCPVGFKPSWLISSLQNSFSVIIQSPRKTVCYQIGSSAVMPNNQSPIAAVKYDHSSFSQWRIMYMTKPTQNTDDPRMTVIRTNSEEANASCTSECQSTNHKAPKADPTPAPTMTWFSVWRRCETRSHDCKQIGPELDCSQRLKTAGLWYEKSNI